MDASENPEAKKPKKEKKKEKKERKEKEKEKEDKQGKKKKKKDKKKKKKKKRKFSCRCCVRAWETFQLLNSDYRKASACSLDFLTSKKGANLTRLLIQLGMGWKDTTNFFQLFTKIDDDLSGMVTLDEFFIYLNIDW